ncbi:MAG: hypothetical protein MAGBODY4_01351 [Candidatus Marinimicrobia bacterium]|nr:hypothetical protein [Candidatus Neomarinimicrobiota bacterium]
MRQNNAIIALHEDSALAGFCYIETWTHGKYVAISGLIVVPEFREHGLGKRIKQAVFELSRRKYPDAKIFGITTTPAVMKINSDLGYRPVSFDDFTRDEEFWDGCQSCPNYDILTRNNRRNCLCTGMLYDPENEENQSANPTKNRSRDSNNGTAESSGENTNNSNGSVT